MTEVSEAALLIQLTLIRSMRQQTGNISHSRKDSHARRTPKRKYYYSHARHATSLYTKSWLVLCDCRAMMNTALQTLMRHLHRLFTLSLSLSFAPALELQQVFCFFLPPARNPKGYNLQDATGRFLNSYKNRKKDNLEPHPDSVFIWVRNFARIRKIKINWRIFCHNIPFFFWQKNFPNFPQIFEIFQDI